MGSIYVRSRDRHFTTSYNRAVGLKVILCAMALVTLLASSASSQYLEATIKLPDTFWLQVPKAAYNRDARIVVELNRVTGGYVSLAKLKLFQIEEQTGGDGGVQSGGTNFTFVTRLRGCSPNPFTRTTAINYDLACSGPVALTVHDVSGRLVRRLETGPRSAGRHGARWDGTDVRGRREPAGVYFVRLSADGKAMTGRLTLVR